MNSNFKLEKHLKTRKALITNQNGLLNKYYNKFFWEWGWVLSTYGWNKSSKMTGGQTHTQKDRQTDLAKRPGEWRWKKLYTDFNSVQWFLSYTIFPFPARPFPPIIKAIRQYYQSNYSSLSDLLTWAFRQDQLNSLHFYS